MDNLLEDFKKELPEGRTHLMDKLGKRDLARYVDTLFIKHSCYPVGDNRFVLYQLEVAYQVIQFLLEDEDEYVPGVIQNEDDWRWFFQLGTGKELQEILKRKKKRQEDMLMSHKLEEEGNI